MGATCAGELALGLVVAFGRPRVWLFAVQLAAIAAFTAILAVHEPVLLLHPYGALTKNLPLLAMLAAATLVAREGWTPRVLAFVRGGLAIIWITEGLGPKILYPQPIELELLRGLHLAGEHPEHLLLAAGILELAAGLVLIFARGRALWWLLAAQLAALLILPVMASMPDPRLWVHPFGPLIKNAPIIAGTIALAVQTGALSGRTFMTARWSNLALFTYAVPPELLVPRLPPGVELDLRDGKAFVSVVSLDFSNTRVLGVPWPFFRSFTDLNFRFYVKRGDQRGVVFIREIVESAVIASVARLVFGEPFLAAKLESEIREEAGAITALRTLGYRGRANTFSVRASTVRRVPAPDGEEHFFKERTWGFNARARFQVLHPVWEIHAVEAARIDLDFGTVYGPEWAFLRDAEPWSVMLAAGSDVIVRLP